MEIARAFTDLVITNKLDIEFFIIRHRLPALRGVVPCCACTASAGVPVHYARSSAYTAPAAVPVVPVATPVTAHIYALLSPVTAAVLRS